MDLSRIEYLGLDRVLKRGSGEIIAQDDCLLLIRDSISGAYMLACDNKNKGITLLDRYIDEKCKLLMTTDYELGKAAFERYGFAEKLDCYQAAYYGKKPFKTPISNS